ncbi:MAG: hypothetical protein ACRDNK_10690 [Solirubrobacteraceae bacterium]
MSEGLELGERRLVARSVWWWLIPSIGKLAPWSLEDPKSGSRAINENDFHG